MHTEYNFHFHSDQSKRVGRLVFRIPVRTVDYSLFSNVQTGSWADPASNSVARVVVSQGYNDRVVMLTTHRREELVELHLYSP